LLHRAYSSSFGVADRLVAPPFEVANTAQTAPGGVSKTLLNPKEPSNMKVKWKQQIARLIPAATAIAAVVLTIGAHADSVKWG
jgi:hypothetical protein